MLNKRGHITMAILVLLLGAVTMMLILFRSGKNLKPTYVEEQLLKTQPAAKGSSSRELAKRDRGSGSYTKKEGSSRETHPSIERSERGIEGQTTKPSEQPSLASTPVRREPRITKRFQKLRIEEKGLQGQEDVDSRKDTILQKEDNGRQKEFLEKGIAASLPSKKTETTKGSEKPKVVNNDPAIDAFESSSPNDRGFKEEAGVKKGDSSEKPSLEQDTFTVVSKKDIEEVQRKCWAALEYLKD